MIITAMVDRVLLRQQRSKKQRLYAQMKKDKINGPVLQKLSEAIGKINTKLCEYHGTKR